MTIVSIPEFGDEADTEDLLDADVMDDAGDAEVSVEPGRTHVQEHGRG